MLSIENSPPDPPCSCKIPGLKSDERVSDKFALQEADLLNTGLDHADDDDQLPNFSIRDYVFTARRKDIETNWPFPQQYLQLCLKHGIKDLLPPFEPPDSVRNRCFGVEVEGKETTVEVGVIEEEKIDGESNCIKYATSPNIHESVVLRSSNQAQSPLQEEEKSTVDPIDTNLCGSRGLDDATTEREDPSTVISHAQSERQSVPTNSFPCSVQEATTTTTTLSEASIELDQDLDSRCAPEKNIESSGKKCRLILKLGTASDPNHTEDITSNTTTVSDPMASKVCPVCKMFSSTSNTTLNAHIDQCLAVESTSKWALDPSKLTKYRVKPRKKRLMVDIYKTAPQCTLEDLDRRNGSNWATDLSLVTAEAKSSAEGKRPRLSRVDVEDTGNESAVYFDSKGTKLRILSKFCDASMATVGEDSSSRKHIKDGKESKISSIDKKKCLRPKHSKNLKSKPQKKKSWSLEPDRSKICGPPETKYGMEKNGEKEESLSDLLKGRDHINRSESGALGKWVGSKRTGSLKNFNSKDGCKGLEYPSRMEMDSSIESNQSKLDNYSVKGNHSLNLPSPLENPVSSPKSKRVESPFYGTQITDKGAKSHYLTNGSTSSHGGCMLKLSRTSGNFASSPRSKRIGVHTGSIQNSKSLPKTALNMSKTSHLVSTKGKQRNTLRNGLSDRPPFSCSKSNENEKCTVLKKSRMRKSLTDISQGVGVLSSNTDEQYDWMHDSSENLSGSLDQMQGNHKSDGSNDVTRPDAKEITDEVSNGRSEVLKSRIEIEREEPMTLERLLSGPEFCVSDATDHFQQFHRSNNLTGKFDRLEIGAEEVPLNEDTVVTHFSKKDIDRYDIRSTETLVSEIQNPVHPSDTQSNSLRSIEEFKRLVCRPEVMMPLMEQSLCESRAIFCANNVGGRNIGQNSHVALEVDCRTDSVPVSRSLLPSIGVMGSDEFPDNSSLTSSKMLSSQDRHMMIDRDSSGSPISAMSTISHPTMARSDANYLEPESTVGLSVQDSFVSGFSGRSGGSDQPCCCSRKDNISLGAGLTHQEFQHPRQRPVPQMMLPSKVKQTSYNPNIRPEMFNSPSSRSDEMVAPFFESSRASVPINASAPNHVDFSSVGRSSQVHHPQSTSSPVLRLMGKNLMVVNKEEDMSMQTRQPPPSSLNDCPNMKYLTLLGFSPSNISNSDCLSFHHTGPDGSVIISQNSCNPPPPPPCFDTDPSKSSRSPITSKTHQTPPQPVQGNHNNMDMRRFNGYSFPQHGLKGRFDLQTQQKSPISRPNSPFNVERVVTASKLKHRNPVSDAQAAINATKEVIVIDDSAEKEAESSMICAKYTEGSRGRQQSSVGILPPTPSYPNLRHMSAFSCHQSTNPFSRRELQVEPMPSYFMSHPRGTNTSPVKQGSTSEASSGVVPLRSPFTDHFRRVV